MLDTIPCYFIQTFKFFHLAWQVETIINKRTIINLVIFSDYINSYYIKIFLLDKECRKMSRNLFCFVLNVAKEVRYLRHCEKTEFVSVHSIPLKNILIVLKKYPWKKY